MSRPKFKFTSTQERKARLIHRCSCCKGIIDIGEIYTEVCFFRYGHGYGTKRRCLHHPINVKYINRKRRKK